MNNQKIVNLSDPTHNEDVANQKSMLMKKQKQSTYSLFCQNMQTKVSLLRHSSKKKQHVGITQTTTQTEQYFIKTNFVLLLLINQD